MNFPAEAVHMAIKHQSEHGVFPFWHERTLAFWRHSESSSARFIRSCSGTVAVLPAVFDLFCIDTTYVVAQNIRSILYIHLRSTLGALVMSRSCSSMIFLSCYLVGWVVKAFYSLAPCITASHGGETIIFCDILSLHSCTNQFHGCALGADSV